MVTQDQDEHNNHPDVDQSSTKFRSTLSQIVGATAFGFVIMGVGLIFAMPTIVNGELNHVNATSIHGFSLDEHAASWFGSILFISQPIGSLISGFLQDLFGRKRCMMIVNIPQLIGWYLLYISNSVPMLYLSVTIMGLSIGFMEAPVLSYIGEITEPRLRGVLSSIAGVFLNVGIMLEFYIGAITYWRTMALISALGPVLTFLMLSQVPESPAWLVYKGRISDAERALCWLRGWVSPEQVSKELTTLVQHMDKNKKPRIIKSTDIEYKQVPLEDSEQDEYNKKKGNEALQNFKYFLKPATQRPLRLILIYFFCSHCASLIGIRPFLVNIFNTLNLPIDSRWVVVMVGTLQVLGSLGCMALMKLLGKRGLTFLSLALCIFLALGLVAYILIGTVIPWIPLVLFCALFFAAQLGIGSIPWMLISEVFPIQGRGVAGGVSAACGYSFIFIVTKSFIHLEEWFHLHGALFVYVFVGILGTIYLYFCLPETEGKTLQEIEPYFFKNKKRNENIPI